MSSSLVYSIKNKENKTNIDNGERNNEKHDLKYASTGYFPSERRRTKSRSKGGSSMIRWQ